MANAGVPQVPLGPGDGLARDGEMRLLAELSDAARTERSRLADALHDDVLQLVAVARQDVLESIQDGADHENLAALLGDIQTGLRDVIASTDDGFLEDLPLRDAVERMAMAAATRSRFAVRVAVDDEAMGVHDAAVRGWVRELLANTAKHAHAADVAVQVLASSDLLEVVVRDDGPGFDPDAAFAAGAAGHVGLRRLERAALMLGGVFTIGRDSGETVARVQIPRRALAEQRRTEDELGVERRWSAGLVAAIRDPLLVVRDDHVVQVNAAMVELTGFASAELVGRATQELPFWGPVQRERNADRFARLAKRSGGEAIVPMARADGSRFNAHWSVQWIGDGVGGGVGSLVVVRDLTEQERVVEQAEIRSELSATIETTRLLAEVLDAARLGWDPMCAALGDLLTAHLGWIDVVVNVRRGDEWAVEWTSSSEAAVLLGERYADEELRPLLDPAFDRGGVFVSLEEDGVAVDGLTVVVGPRSAMAADSVRGGDTWLVPVHDREGRSRAIISVDRPRTGLRPTSTQLQALAAIAPHVGLAFELLDAAG